MLNAPNLIEMKVKYSRSRHNAKQTSFTSPTGARPQCGEQEHVQYCTNHDVRLKLPSPRNVSILSSLMAPLQLVSHVVQNRHVGEQQTHWEKTNKEDYHFNDVSSLLVLSQCVLCSQHGCFVLRERPALRLRMI